MGGWGISGIFVGLFRHTRSQGRPGLNIDTRGLRQRFRVRLRSVPLAIHVPDTVRRVWYSGGAVSGGEGGGGGGGGIVTGTERQVGE